MKATQVFLQCCGARVLELKHAESKIVLELQLQDEQKTELSTAV